MLTRRSVLAAGAAAAAVGPWPRRARAAVELKLSHFLPTANGMHVDFMEPWAREVERRTDGAVTVAIFPAGTQLGNVATQYEQVRAGVVDIAHGLHGIPAGRFPRTSIIDLPFIAQTADGASRALWALHDEHFAQEYEGVKVLAVHAHNAGLIHTRGRQVKTMDDLRGLRIRFPSTPTRMMLEQLGAVPVGLPPGQIYENLQKGVIDGLVMPWDPMHSFKLAELVEYHLDARCYTVSFFFVMNERRYETLPDDVRGAIDDLSGEALVARFGPWWDRWDQWGKDASAQRRSVVTVLDDAERIRWIETLAPVTDAYLAELEGAGVDNARAIHAELKEAVAGFEGRS
jgi:TRAP-type C4-dicarboxylate transport system substrate-binding protein